MQRYARSARLAAVLAVLVIACAPGLAADAKPILLTSIGQSAEASMIKQLCVRGKIPYELNALAKAEELAGGDKQPRYSALVAVVGGSAKGLGAAGINKEQELERSVALLEKARSLRMSIIIMHVGGVERRRRYYRDAFILRSTSYGRPCDTCGRQRSGRAVRTGTGGQEGAHNQSDTDL